jgi:MFS family permease
MGIANTGGRIVLGAVADRVGRLRIMQVSSAVMTLAVLAWPLATAFGSLVAFGLVYGTAAGAFIALLPALAGDYFGPRRLGGVTGLIFGAAAIGTLLSSPVSGAIFEAAGGYTAGIVVAAATLGIGTIPLLLLSDPRKEAAVAEVLP